MKEELFTPGQTVEYNPLQKKVTVESVFDTRKATGEFGAPRTTTIKVNGAPASNLAQLGLPTPNRNVVSDENGQVSLGTNLACSTPTKHPVLSLAVKAACVI
jgi:hypothetical protein